MFSVKRLVGAALVAGAITVGGVATTSAAWAGVEACGLGADAPNSALAGTGSRSGCSGTVTLTVLVQKDVFGPDKLAGSVTRTNFGNGSLTAHGSCTHGRGSYYTETRSSSGNKIQSGRVVRC